MATAVALDRGPRYYGEYLSENIIETPEGYRICKNAVIGRSGFQTYRAHEIEDKEGLLKGHFQGDDAVELWRDPSEVFSAATLSSFEGKPFTLNHPEELLDTESTRDHQYGHVQNIRKGGEPLEDGNFPILADIHVTDAEAIQHIDNGERQLSCGYAYQLAKDGERFEQRNILGNHVALVPKGRAGAEARINDSALPEIEKERKPVKNPFAHIFGLGLKEFIKSDASPEEVLTAVNEAQAESNKRIVAKDEAAKDSEESITTKSERLILIGRDSKGSKLYKSVALDSEEESEVESKDEKKVEESEDEEPPKVDEKATMDAERARRLHGIVDALMQADAEKSSKMAEENDADLEELKRLLTQYLGEEEKEGMHAGDAEMCPECDSPMSECSCDKAADAKEEEEEKSEDASEEEEKSEDASEEEAEAGDAEIVRSEPVLAKEDVQEHQKEVDKAMDARVASGQLALLKALRPIVASANNRKLNAAFDMAFQGVRAKAKKASTGKGSHAAFRKAASHAKDAVATELESAAQVSAREFEEKMKKVLQKGREQNHTTARRA